MSKRQLAIFFVICLCGWVVGNGLAPLLPVYATRLGATPAQVGYYLSSAYVALAAGALASGWVFERVGRPRMLLVSCGVLGVPLTLLTGRVTSVWQLAALNAASWFLGGMGFALVSILTSLAAGKGERGRVFGILTVSNGLGTLIGGLTFGPIADRWGYSALFAAASLPMVLWALAALLSGVPARLPGRRGPAAAAQPRLGLGLAFQLLFVAVILAAIGLYVSVLSRSLVMQGRGFSAAAISSTGAVTGAVLIPLPFLAGWLSDRIGRKRVLWICYLAIAAGLVVLTRAVALWHFWVALALTSFFSGSTPVSSALAADLLPPEGRARGMARYSAATWLGGIVGMAATGNALQHLGVTPTLMVGTCLPLIAIVLLAAIRRPAPRLEPAVDATP